MKRATSMLGALAMLAAGFLFAAPAAHAYTINCTAVSVTGYYGTIQKCGTVSTQKANTMASTLTNMSTDAKSKLSADTSFTMYMFKDLTDYDTFFDERYANPPAGTSASDWAHDEPAAIGAKVWGRTAKTVPDGIPVYSLIFLADLDNTSIDTYANVGWVTAHEAGHWLEYYYRSLVNASTTSAAFSNIYVDLLDQDWVNFNELADCTSGGVFYTRKDFANTYICSGASGNQSPLAGAYSSAADNKEVMLSAYASIFGDVREIFATSVAKLNGFSDDGASGIATQLTSPKFSCSQYLVYKMIEDGELPTVTELEGRTQPGGGDAECPTSGSGWPTLNN
ncbi:MAG: hypothetical protein AB7M93_30550 [Candidatus Obscuribacterales bacterium]